MMARRKPEFQTLDPSTWPTVAWTGFDATVRESIRTRTTAIEQYARGAAIKEIEQTTGVDRRQLYRLLERALTAHPDGRIYGFRALIAHTRVADYVRISPVKLNGERGSRGAVGAMSLLLERFPVLARWLQLQIKQHRVALVEIRTGGELRTRPRGLQGLHSGFLQQCRQCGLVATDYPFNTASHAIRSLSARVKSELLSGFGVAAVTTRRIWHSFAPCLALGLIDGFARHLPPLWATWRGKRAHDRLFDRRHFSVNIHVGVVRENCSRKPLIFARVRAGNTHV